MAAVLGNCWAATFLALAPHPTGPLLAPLLALSPALAWIDAHCRKLPDVLTAPLWASQPLLLLVVSAGKDTLCGAQLLGAIGMDAPGGDAGTGAANACLGAASWAWLATVAIGAVLVFGLRAMGLGDVKLAAPIAASLAFLSPELALTWLLLSGVLGGIGAAAALALRRVGWRGHIPLGPYLLTSLGLVTALLTPQ
ncbi:MAG: prepilin peptidase [Buchananella hordeovulneris]|nr:prepilin peptidase [Buchananella hordeovulneris]